MQSEKLFDTEMLNIRAFPHLKEVTYHVLLCAFSHINEDTFTHFIVFAAQFS